MTPREELIRQMEKRLLFLMERINFHAGFPQARFHVAARHTLIEEAAAVQSEIDAIRAGASEDLERWNYNIADEGQD